MIELSKRYIRLMFEQSPVVNINHKDTFKHYVENYLSHIPNARFAGFASIDAKQRFWFKLEPVWQVIVDINNEDGKRMLMDYVYQNPLAGYHVHAYEHDASKNSNEIHILSI